jgi:hypothetical protein
LRNNSTNNGTGNGWVKRSFGSSVCAAHRNRGIFAMSAKLARNQPSAAEDLKHTFTVLGQPQIISGGAIAALVQGSGVEERSWMVTDGGTLYTGRQTDNWLAEAENAGLYTQKI